MGHCNQFPVIFNWDASNPVTNFLPRPANQTGSVASGVLAGAMASTNVIYSQIIEKSRQQNLNLEVTWTGTPTGTFEVLVSNSGINFYALTFDPVLDQPAGSAGGYDVNLSVLSAKYILLRYTNASGSGSLTVYGQFQDVN